MGWMFPERAPGLCQLGASRRSPATVGAVSETAAEPSTAGAAQRAPAVAAGGSGGPQGEAEVAAGVAQPQGGAVCPPRGAGCPRCGHHGPATAPRPARPAGRGHICISTTSFAYPHFNICIDTPRRSPYLADVIPSRSPIGGRRAAGPPPYIGRAAGRLPRSALRPGGGTDQLQLPPPPPP